MKLELKHLAPYLPYGLKMYIETGNHIDGYKKGSYLLTGDAIDGIIERQNMPILRPLSDYDRFIGDAYCGMYEITSNVAGLHVDGLLGVSIKDKVIIDRKAWIPLLDFYNTIQVLFRYHFDVFGLIEQGLAIDINTLTPHHT